MQSILKEKEVRCEACGMKRKKALSGQQVESAVDKQVLIRELAIPLVEHFSYFSFNHGKSEEKAKAGLKSTNWHKQRGIVGPFFTLS